MYILHYHHVQCDYCEHELIAVSQDKGKLEKLREEILAPSRKFYEENEVYQKECAKRKASAQKIVREFLERNIECVKEIRPRLFDGTRYVPDYHYTSTKPYEPEKKRQEQGRAIDLIVSTYWMEFQRGFVGHSRLGEFINQRLLTEDLPDIHYSLPEHPTLEGKIYDEGSVVIEEIKEL